MTLNEFAENNDVSAKTVNEWLNKDYIPGSYFNNENNEWVIPNSARPPYTKARAKAKQSIYQSIVKAAVKRNHVFPKLYKITQSEFDSYIEILVNANYIKLRVEDGLTYYDETLNSMEFLSSNLKRISELISTQTEAITKAVTLAMLDKSLSA